MKVSFNGYDQKIITFEATDSIPEGTPVKVSGNGKVSACSANDVPCGICVSYKGGFAAVQLSGYVSADYSVNSGESAVNPALGSSILVAAGSGKFKAASSGLQVLVVELDSTNHKIGFIF